MRGFKISPDGFYALSEFGVVEFENALDSLPSCNSIVRDSDATFGVVKPGKLTSRLKPTIGSVRATVINVSL